MKLQLCRLFLLYLPILLSFALSLLLMLILNFFVFILFLILFIILNLLISGFPLFKSEHSNVQIQLKLLAAHKFQYVALLLQSNYEYILFSFQISFVTHALLRGCILFLISNHKGLFLLFFYYSFVNKLIFVQGI